MSETHGRSAYVPHIDGLRALAVLSVIAFHLDASWLRGGLAGVDVFFVISGFVVSASLANFRKTSSLGFFAFFYARRMLRILPALVVCLVVTHVASAMFVPYAWLSDANERAGLAAFFGLSNFVLADTSGSYFAPRAAFNPFTHTWSLGVEEQFYLIFPPLFAGWLASGRARVVSCALFALGFVVSVIVAFWLAKSDAVMAFYMLASRFWELAAGVLLYQILVFAGHPFAEHDRPATRMSGAVALVSIVAIGCGLVTANPLAFPMPGAVLPVLGTLGVLASLHGREPRGLVARVLRLRPVVLVGRISYSLYLWHWPVIVLMRWTCGVDSLPMRALALVLTFALAGASYVLIEQPPRLAAKRRAIPRGAVIAAGVATVAIAWAFSADLQLHRASVSQTKVAAATADWYPGLLTADDAPGCTLASRLEPVGASNVRIFSGASCKPASTQPRIFAIGDSHTEAYATLLMLYAIHTGADVYKYANGACPFASFMPAREAPPCGENSKAALAHVMAHARPGDVLLLASLRLERFSNQDAQLDEKRAWTVSRSPAANAARAKSIDAVVAALKPLADRGLRIVFEAPKPLLRAPPFRCVDWFNASNPVCAPGLDVSRDEMLRYRAPVMSAIADVQRRVSRVSVWDPLPLLCADATCDALRDGRPLFYDADHVSGYANRLLAPDFERHIAALGPMPVASG